MSRARIIKPGIMTNEKLAALGPYATLLFERLWMLADREGRLEYRPQRIHAEAFPYWPDVSVEKLVEDLCKSGFIRLYGLRGTRGLNWIEVINFRIHQPIHPHEKRSVFPAPPSARNGSHLRDADVITSNDMPRRRRDKSRNDSDTSTSTSTSTNGERAREKSGPEETEEKPPTPPPPSVKNKHAPKRREPGRATTAATTATASADERPRSPKASVNFWPHSAEGVEAVRGLLTGIGEQARLAPPDDEILRRALDAARGASAEAVYHALRKRWNQGRFRSMQSWGLIPLVVGSIFRAA